MPITYATSHIDGGLDCSSLSIGILKSMPDSPIVKAMVIAGQQAHPIWALDRLALVIYCYVQSAKYHYPRGPLPIQVNVRSSLISNESTSCIVADSIIWHTSESDSLRCGTVDRQNDFQCASDNSMALEG